MNPRLTAAAHSCPCAQFEPFQEVSFFFLLCGGAGTGKSMRAMRMQDLLCDGWIKKSGTTSARAGMNGGARRIRPLKNPPAHTDSLAVGMDNLCGRLVYYDEMTNDFGGDNAERMCAAKPPTLPPTPNRTERHVCCLNREYLKQSPC